MKRHPHQPLSTEDLAELYVGLKRRIERLEGIVRQIQAEGTRATLDRLTANNT